MLKGSFRRKKRAGAILRNVASLDGLLVTLRVVGWVSRRASSDRPVRLVPLVTYRVVVSVQEGPLDGRPSTATHRVFHLGEQGTGMRRPKAVPDVFCENAAENAESAPMSFGDTSQSCLLLQLTRLCRHDRTAGTAMTPKTFCHLCCTAQRVHCLRRRYAVDNAAEASPLCSLPIFVEWSEIFTHRQHLFLNDRSFQNSLYHTANKLHPCLFHAIHLPSSHSNESIVQKTVKDASQEAYATCMFMTTLETPNSLCVRQKSNKASSSPSLLQQADLIRKEKTVSLRMAFLVFIGWVAAASRMQPVLMGTTGQCVCLCRSIRLPRHLV